MFMATWGQCSFQDGLSPLMEQLIFLHDHIMFVLVMIIMLVGYVLFTMVFEAVMWSPPLDSPVLNRHILEGQEIEVIWTVLPALLLGMIAFPSLKLLYLMDEVGKPELTIKVVGHQWFWSYEYSDFNVVEFDSMLSGMSDLDSGDMRLLEVDRRMIVPIHYQVRLLVTADDVIHSWALPVLGVKVDAVPGRLNQASFIAHRLGVYHGQCSEICGANHSFMPISVEVVTLQLFSSWIEGFID